MSRYIIPISITFLILLLISFSSVGKDTSQTSLPSNPQIFSAKVSGGVKDRYCNLSISDGGLWIDLEANDLGQFISFGDPGQGPSELKSFVIRASGIASKNLATSAHYYPGEFHFRDDESAVPLLSAMIRGTWQYEYQIKGNKIEKVTAVIQFLDNDKVDFLICLNSISNPTRIDVPIRHMIVGERVRMSGLRFSCEVGGLRAKAIRDEDDTSLPEVPEHDLPIWTTSVDQQLEVTPPSRAKLDCVTGEDLIQVTTAAGNVDVQGECGADSKGERSIDVTVNEKKIFENARYESRCQDFYLKNIFVSKKNL